MKNLIKGFLLVALCLAARLNAAAQDEQATITGMFTKKCDADISITCKVDGKSVRLGGYVVDTTSTKFCFAVPLRANGVYQIQITLKKNGHRRLENALTESFPLSLAANQNLNITVDPLQMANGKQTGLVAEQGPVKFKVTSISGSFNNVKFNPTMNLSLSLEKVSGGSAQGLQSFYFTAEKPFYHFLIPVEKEGLYYISIGNRKKCLYIKPNDQLELAMDMPSFATTSWVKTTPENQLITQWEQLIAPVKAELAAAKADDPTFVSAFTAVYQPLQAQIPGLIKQAKAINPKFSALFATAVKVDDNLIAFNMLLRSKYQTRGKFLVPAKYFAEVPTYYKQVIAENKINQANILQVGGGMEYVETYAKFNITGLENDSDKMKLMMGATSNDTLKASLLKSRLESLDLDDLLEVGNYSEFRDVFMPYKKYASTASAKEKYDKVYSTFAADTAFIGKSAYNFTLPDKDGKMVSMKDFKGKVVFIDTWATWCGPCKAQIPFLQVLEKDYKGNNNIVFVGISIDKVGDKQKWLDMLKDKDMDGVQLLDDVGKAFARPYKIDAIPRFLLIDKNGKWVEIRCALPEKHDKLKAYLDKAIAAN